MMIAESSPHGICKNPVQWKLLSHKIPEILFSDKSKFYLGARCYGFLSDGILNAEPNEKEA